MITSKDPYSLSLVRRGRTDLPPKLTRERFERGDIVKMNSSLADAYDLAIHNIKRIASSISKGFR